MDRAAKEEVVTGRKEDYCRRIINEEVASSKKEQESGGPFRRYQDKQMMVTQAWLVLSQIRTKGVASTQSTSYLIN